MAKFIDSLFDTGEYLAANLLGSVKVSLMILSLVLFGVLLYVFWRWWQVPPWPKAHERAADTMRAHHGSQSRIEKQWNKIKARLQEPAEAEWKVAVIEADMLVDDVLRRMEYPGDTMGDRLKSITKDQIRSLDSIWTAHKIRNRIVHDPDIRMQHRDARDAIAGFESFLKDVGLVS